MSLEGLREVTVAGRWTNVAESVAASKQHSPPSLTDFETYWIEAGHRIREQIDDDRLLCILLRRALPKYEGEAVTLFRGENIGRWKLGLVGFAWTEQLEVARMFGRGINAIQTGGVLLKTTFEPSSIISGPNKHSQYLCETQFAVDPISA
jgi:hypothetical protein